MKSLGCNRQTLQIRFRKLGARRSTRGLEMHTVNSLTTESPAPFPAFRLEYLDNSFWHHSFAFIIRRALWVLSRININAYCPRVCTQSVGASDLPKIVCSGK